MPGVTSDMLLQRMKAKHKMILEKQDMLNWIKENKPSLVVMAGAGDIDALVQPVKAILEQ